MPTDDAKTCLRCKGRRMFAFEPGAGLPAKPKDLPVVCRDCGLITIGGAAVSFPPELEAQAKLLAESAANAGELAAQGLMDDPRKEVAAYFTRTYRAGYLEGFWRALLFWRHNEKTGRIKRLRALWRKLTDYPVVKLWLTEAELIESPEVYAAWKEIEQLLTLGDPGGTSPSNESPPVPSGDAQVP